MVHVREILPPARPSTHLQLRCLACGARDRYELEHVSVCSRDLVEEAGLEWPEGWDGLFAATPVTCTGCGAVDQYELDATALLALTARVLAGAADGGGILVGVPKLWDMTVVRRPSEAIAYLRGQAEEAPTDGARWRRLGNFCERAGLLQEAADAWTRAVRDPSEAEAAYSIAMQAMFEEADEVAFAYARVALERAVDPHDRSLRLDGQRIAQLVEVVADLAPVGWSMHATWLGEPVGNRAVVNASSARLDGIHRWDRLARFWVEERPLGVLFAPTDPEHAVGETTLLERWLSGHRAPDLVRAVQPARAAPRDDRHARKKKRKQAKKARRGNRGR